MKKIFSGLEHLFRKMPVKKSKNDGPERIGVGPFVHPGEGKGCVGAIAKAKGISFDAAADILAKFEGDFQAAIGNVRAPLKFHLGRRAQRSDPHHARFLIAAGSEGCGRVFGEVE